MARWAHGSVNDVAREADDTIVEVRHVFAMTGGIQAEAEHLDRVRSGLREIAVRRGYPEARGLHQQQQFDNEAAIFLHEQLGAVEGEALRAQVWQYISCALAPDVVVWRWRREGKGVTEDRFLGGNRNCFGRLWLRAIVFRDQRLQEPWYLVRSLSEDNYTAILERPGFSRYRDACRELARAFLLRRSLVEDLRSVASPGQTLLRETMLRITRHAAFIALSALSEDELRAFIGSQVDQALQALGGQPLPEGELVQRQPELRLPMAAESTGPGTTPKAPAQLPTVRPAVAGTTAALAAPSPAISSPMTAQAPSQVDESRDFLTMTPDERMRAVWEVLVGEGEASEDELIRAAAVALRERGLMRYERLREGGLLYSNLEAAMDRGRRSGLFDVPMRGHRRAICRSADEVPAFLWTRELKQVVKESGPLSATVAIRSAIASLRQLVDIRGEARDLEEIGKRHVRNGTAAGYWRMTDQGLEDGPTNPSRA